MSHAKLLILGSGPAGYTAAIYAARALVEPVIVGGHEVGGQMATTTDVENYPGFADIIHGPWLMEQMRAQAKNVGTRFVSAMATRIDFSVRPFRVILDRGEPWTCDALVLATGAKARWLGLPSEEKYKGSGVSACATCDGFFYKNREVVVVGGGNTAVEEALYMANIASKVTIVHRRSEFRAERLLQQRLLQRENVQVIWNSAVEEVFGEDSPPSMTGLRIRNLTTNELADIKADGLFVAIGHEPATALVKDHLRLKPNGYVWTQPNSTATSIPGVFAAGDVTDEIFRQAVTAAGMGCMAALEAEKYLQMAEAHSEAAE
jgi:thioredoxin reductase (NADPH)